jgi:hypothetical protein
MTKLYVGGITPRAKKQLTDIVEALIKQIIKAGDTRRGANQIVNLLRSGAKRRAFFFFYFYLIFPI